MAANVNAADARHGIDGKSNETTTKETTTLTTLLLDTTDNRPAAAIICEVPGCDSHSATHSPRDGAAGFVHTLAPLPGHEYDVSLCKLGAGQWLGWAQIDTSQALMTADEFRELSTLFAHEATRLDVLNAGGSTVTGPGGQLLHPDSLLMEALVSADIASRAVTRSRYIITAGA